MVSVERLFHILAPRKEKAFCPCAVVFLGNPTTVLLLRRLREEHALFLLRSSQRYFGARFLRDLKVTIFDCVFINCCLVFHPKLSNIGLIAASKLLFVTILAALFWSFGILPGVMDKLESVQYSAARTIICTWKGTSREKLYSELGWEPLNCRRWRRLLTLFYKIINNLTPAYTKDLIPPLNQSNYTLRNQDVVGRIRTRTGIFKYSFYSHCLSEWNRLDPENRLA